MSIGKDSITKRVAKSVAPEAKSAPAKKASPAKKSQAEKNIAPELVATVGVAPVAKKTPAKKTTSTTKKPAAKKDTVVERLTPPEIDPKNKITLDVLGNVSPETVKAVIGHAEDEKYEKVQIGQKMPNFLL